MKMNKEKFMNTLREMVADGDDNANLFAVMRNKETEFAFLRIESNLEEGINMITTLTSELLFETFKNKPDDYRQIKSELFSKLALDIDRKVSNCLGKEKTNLNAIQ